jgi:hypothetical protein
MGRFLSVEDPEVWVIDGDPDLDDALSGLLSLMAEQYRVKTIRFSERQTYLAKLAARAATPCAVLFGALHIHLREPLISELADCGEVAAVLYGSPDSATAGAAFGLCGLDTVIDPGLKVSAQRALLDSAIRRTLDQRLSYDQLRLILRDAKVDLERTERWLGKASND